MRTAIALALLVASAGLAAVAPPAEAHYHIYTPIAYVCVESYLVHDHEPPNYFPACLDTAA